MEKRFFVLKENISNNQILVDGEEHNHLSKVLRLKPNDSVECFFDGSQIFDCVVKSVSKNNSVLDIVGTKNCNSNPKVCTTLFQALPKLDKLEFITQKLCEIGVSKIVPFVSKFCVAKENSNKIDRLKKISISACKQCGRTKLLDVSNVVKFSDVLKLLKDFDLVFFANETEQNLKLENFLLTKNLTKVAYVVGSEGGFSKDEIESLKAIQNLKSISLGSRILRTETASLVLGTLICHYLGEI